MQSTVGELEFVDDYQGKKSRWPMIFGEWNRLFKGRWIWVIIGVPVATFIAWGIAVIALVFI